MIAKLREVSARPHTDGVVPVDTAGETVLGPDSSQDATPPSRSWIGLVLVDQDGTPVPNRRYRIVKPDGATLPARRRHHQGGRSAQPGRRAEHGGALLLPRLLQGARAGQQLAEMSRCRATLGPVLLAVSACNRGPFGSSPPADAAFAPPDAGQPPPRAAIGLLSPQSTALVTTPTPTLRFRLSGGLSSATVDVCADRRCRVVRGSTTVSSPTVRVTRELPPGAAFWRVRARAVDGGEVCSPTWVFRVGHRKAPWVATSVRILARAALNGSGMSRPCERPTTAASWSVADGRASACALGRIRPRRAARGPS